jgi:hypothetical protein
MELPPFYVEAAVARLRADHSPAKLRQILALLDLDLVEPGPEADFDDLARKARIEQLENEHRGSVIVTGELSLLGHAEPVHLRYSYAGEFGVYPDDFDGFGMLGSVGQLDALVWSADGRTPEWTKVDVGMLSRPILDAIDDLVLAQVVRKTTVKHR